MNKDVLEIIVKTLIYLLSLVGAYLGVSAMAACSVQRQAQTTGRGTGIFHYSDTFSVEHGNLVKFRVK